MRPDSEIHFWHLPKTAGTSVASLIRKAFPTEDCVPAHTIRDLLTMPRDEVPRFRCYTGHFFSTLEPLVGRPLPTVTILRHPTSQALSLLQHCQRKVLGAGWLPPLWARCLHGLWEKIPVLRSPIQQAWCPILMNNFQTRVLGSEVFLPEALAGNFHGLTYPFLEPAFCDPAVDLEALYDKAVRRLETMSVVGTMERLSETLGLVFAMLDLPAPSVIPHENASPRGFVPSAHLLALIEEQTVYDKRLHQLATRLLESQLLSASDSIA